MIGCGDDEPTGFCAQGEDVFKRRIEPLIAGDRPQSCNQCHLSGVDLSMFVRESACSSMACLLEQGEVSFSAPGQSKILDRIRLAKPQSELITQLVIDAEYNGFLAWIEHSAQCHDAACGDVGPNPCGVTKAPPPDGVLDPLGGCSEEAVGQAFETLVFPWKVRCGACHIPGNTVSATAWLDTESSLRTMYNLLGVGAVDTENPHLSEMLTKPLAVGDPSGEGAKHGGGDKFADKTDETYQDLFEWVTYYAACHSGEGPQKPVVTILSPAPGATHDPAVATRFEGQAIDPQNGALDGDALVWTSDQVDDPLGVGRVIEVALPAGANRITLTATDLVGNVGIRHINVIQGGCSGPSDLANINEGFKEKTGGCAEQECKGHADKEGCLENCLIELFSPACMPCVVAYLCCEGDACVEEFEACAGVSLPDGAR